MSPGLIVRPPGPEDAAAMARVHVGCWQETYRGLMPDSLLDDPEFLSRRERMWTRILAGELYPEARVAVAVREQRVVGVALAGEPEKQPSDWSTQLFILYVYAAEHGSGAGAALFDAVVDRRASALLWVADPNPRAQAFYRKQGFVADGASTEEDGVREIRMVRSISGR